MPTPIDGAPTVPPGIGADSVVQEAPSATPGAPLVASTAMKLKEELWPALARIEALQKGAESVTGVPSGFTDLDEMTAGFQPGTVTVVAGRPSMGKTAFAYNVAAHAAIEGNIPVAIFSPEMTKEGITTRLLTAEARIDGQRVRKGMLRDDDYRPLAQAAGFLSSAPIWIDESQDRSFARIAGAAERLRGESGLGLMIIDYLQLLEGPPAESRHHTLAAISRQLKSLAKRLSVPILVLSQCSRAPDTRAGDHRPQLTDIRDSGAIEDDADTVLFLFRQEVYDGPVDMNGESLEGRAEVIVAKQRNGPIGIVNLYFHKQYARFDSFRPSLQR